MAVVEGRGVFGSIGRSWSLTNGYKGQIFVLFLLYLAVASMANTLIQAIVMPFMFTSMSVAFWILGVAVQPLIYTVTGVFTSAAVAALYYELRRVKEGIGAEDAAACSPRRCRTCPCGGGRRAGGSPGGRAGRRSRR